MKRSNRKTLLRAGFAASLPALALLSRTGRKFLPLISVKRSRKPAERVRISAVNRARRSLRHGGSQDGG